MMPTFKLPVSRSVGHSICCFKLLVKTPRWECTQNPARRADAYDRQRRRHLCPTGWLVPNRVCEPEMNLLVLLFHLAGQLRDMSGERAPPGGPGG